MNKNLSVIPAALISLSYFIAEPSLADGIHRAQRPLPSQYIVVLKGTPSRNKYFETEDKKIENEVNAEADRISRKHMGHVRETWHHAIRGMVMTLSEKEAIALAKDPKVALVEEDGIIDLYASQSPVTWGLDRIDQSVLPVDNSYSYNALGTGVTVYVIDTGIRNTHSEFISPVTGLNRASGGFTAINDANGTNDCFGHGTHVAGIIGGKTYGVAKDAKLVSVRVLDCSGSGTTSGVVSGINWVTANKTLPAVANLSLGGGLSPTLDSAVTNSINAGITYAIAAGNSNLDACTQSPSDVAAALTVGASDNTDTRASFSNFGACLDVFAPGVNITSASNTSDTATVIMSGTSMAAPHVAGAAALYLSVYPSATPAQVATDTANGLITKATANQLKNIGTASPNKLLYTPYIVAGPADTVPPAVSLSSPAAAATLSGVVVLSATATDNSGVAKVEFYAGSTLLGVSSTAASSNTYNLSWNSSTLVNGSYALTAKAYDFAGNTSTTAPVTVAVANTAPVACRMGSWACGWHRAPGCLKSSMMRRSGATWCPFTGTILSQT